MKRYRVVWDARLQKQEIFEADDHEWAKTGSVVALTKDGEHTVLVSNFQKILIEEVEQ